MAGVGAFPEQENTRLGAEVGGDVMSAHVNLLSLVYVRDIKESFVTRVLDNLKLF